MTERTKTQELNNLNCDLEDACHTRARLLVIPKDKSEDSKQIKYLSSLKEVLKVLSKPSTRKILIISKRNGPIRREAAALGQGEDNISCYSLAAAVQIVL